MQRDNEDASEHSFSQWVAEKQTLRGRVAEIDQTCSNTGSRVGRQVGPKALTSIYEPGVPSLWFYRPEGITIFKETKEHRSRFRMSCQRFRYAAHRPEGQRKIIRFDVAVGSAQREMAANHSFRCGV